jgi:hypothetical protein
MRNAIDPKSFPKRLFQTDVEIDLAEPRWSFVKNKF